VALSAANLKASAAASAARLGGSGNWLLALPTTHIAGLNVVVRAVLAGGSLTSMPPDSFTAERFSAAAAAMPPGRRYVSLVPTQLARLLAAGPIGAEALAGFEAVLVGGAAISQSLRTAAQAAGVRLVETYGMAETAGGCVYDGVLLDGVEARLERGIIELGGPTVALGYAPPDTGERFFEADGRRWFRTSDLGQWTVEGRLCPTGRIDNAITTGGETISPETVEGELASGIGLEEVLVVGLPDEHWGQTVTALVVPADGAELDFEALRAGVKRRLGPAYAPRWIGAVPGLPKVAEGKLDRAAGLDLAAGLRASGRLHKVG
jgi:O-succinylbenzoic acid--CoA ligase